VSVAAASKGGTAERFRRELTAKRVLIGFLIAALGLASIFNPIAFAIAITAIGVIGAVEFSNIARRAGGEVALPIAVAACAAKPVPLMNFTWPVWAL